MQIYATCPQSKDIPPERYFSAVANASRWSEDCGCTGLLVYTDNGIVDPWLVAQVVIESTERLCPLVAVQPVYMHPYAMATMATSLAYLHGRAVHLNMLAGGFRNDLLSLGDEVPHDDRYARTVEYAQIALGLLRGETVSTSGTYYSVSNLELAPPMPVDLRPEVLVSGSSAAGLAAARALGATSVRYPRRPGEERAWLADEPEGGFGIRIGIIARQSADAAWREAHARFPEDRAGRITHRLAVAVSDSQWHHQLSGTDTAGSAGAGPDGEPDPYWLGPFHTYQTFCPYLVGSYDTVARYLAHYLALGTSTLVLDIPPSEEDLGHTGVVLARVREAVAS